MKQLAQAVRSGCRFRPDPVLAPRRLARDRRAVFLNFPQGDWMITNIRVSAGSAAGRKRIVPMKTTA